MVILLVTSGGILFSLGILAEYLGVAAKNAMGKPLYLIVSDPADGPLGRKTPDAAPAQTSRSEPSDPVKPPVRAEV
jgi:undecaprenyl-phosphate 4-deoxy-4-formamido-L-arabinose transferase